MPIARTVAGFAEIDYECLQLLAKLTYSLSNPCENRLEIKMKAGHGKGKVKDFAMRLVLLSY